MIDFTQAKPSHEPVCPGCGETVPMVGLVLDGVCVPPSAARLQEGDYALCLLCGALGRYKADFTLRSATALEFMKMIEEFPDTALQIHQHSHIARNSSIPANDTGENHE